MNGKTIGYSYDLNGNMLTKTDSLDSAANMAFEYDALNQLVRANQNAITKGLYDYNTEGLRVRHRLSERGDVGYFYDGNAVIEERNAADSSLLAHYRYADRLLSLNTVSGAQYYHHDALGSTVNLTDNAGAVKVSYSLDPWGTIRNQVGTSVNRQIFTGQEHDEQTGLIYFGARYYDSETARFISQDTYLGEYNTPPSLHRYLYAYHNPTVYIDLLGYANVDSSGMPKLRYRSPTLSRLVPTYETVASGSSEEEIRKAADYSVETTPKKITAIATAEAGVVLIPLLPMLPELGLTAYVTAETTIATSSTAQAGLSALGGYNLYKIFTDPEYAAEIMSLGPAALPEAVYYSAKSVVDSAKTLAKSKFVENLKPSNWKSWKLEFDSSTLGMSGGNVRIKSGAGKDVLKLNEADVIKRSASESGATNRTLHEAYKNELRAAMEKPTVSDKDLSSIVDKLYRPNATVGSGSTAAAVRQELATGQPVGEAFHSQKASDSIVELQRWLSRNPVSRPGDRAAAENLIIDMKNALGGL